MSCSPSTQPKLNKEDLVLYYQCVLKYIQLRVNNKLDAEDLAQEVYYKVSKATTEGIDNLCCWICTISKNTIIDYYRKHKSSKTKKNTGLMGASESEDKRLEELVNSIAYFIDNLPGDYREILRLSELEGLSQKEMATRMNLKYSTLRAKVQRGRSLLKSMISDQYHVIQGGRGSILEVIPR